jgi:hypothetical protein
LRCRSRSRKLPARTTSFSRRTRVTRHCDLRKLESSGLLGLAVTIERSLWRTKAVTSGSGSAPTRNMIACFMDSGVGIETDSPFGTAPFFADPFFALSRLLFPRFPCGQVKNRSEARCAPRGLRVLSAPGGGAHQVVGGAVGRRRWAGPQWPARLVT